MDPGDIAAYRAMTLQQRLDRSLLPHAAAREFKFESVRMHHPGWSEEKVMNKVRRWVGDGMNPAELYEWWPPDD